MHKSPLLNQKKVQDTSKTTQKYPTLNYRHHCPYMYTYTAFNTDSEYSQITPQYPPGTTEWGATPVPLS